MAPVLPRLPCPLWDSLRGFRGFSNCCWRCDDAFPFSVLSVRENLHAQINNNDDNLSEFYFPARRSMLYIVISVISGDPLFRPLRRQLCVSHAGWRRRGKRRCALHPAARRRPGGQGDPPAAGLSALHGLAEGCGCQRRPQVLQPDGVQLHHAGGHAGQVPGKAG